jgi:chemotaxis signal transduction protein
MSHTNAWILDFGMNTSAAVGGRELLHLIDLPKTFAVPCTPPYCRRVIFWQGRLLPVMDIATRLGSAPKEVHFVAIVGYQHKRGEYPQFGALQLVSPPRQEAVSDEQACSLPEKMQDWEGMAIACFESQGEAVPVLNLNRLFGTPPNSTR